LQSKRYCGRSELRSTKPRDMRSTSPAPFAYTPVPNGGSCASAWPTKQTAIVNTDSTLSLAAMPDKRVRSMMSREGNTTLSAHDLCDTKARVVEWSRVGEPLAAAQRNTYTVSGLNLNVSCAKVAEQVRLTAGERPGWVSRPHISAWQETTRTTEVARLLDFGEPCHKRSC
jgi:hypothetical protein